MEEERLEDINTEKGIKQRDLKREEILEKANEIDDGAFETWCEENKEELENSFAEESEFEGFCKNIYDEEFRDWFRKNKGDYIENFAEESSGEFEEYCKERWNETNE